MRTLIPGVVLAAVMMIAGCSRPDTVSISGSTTVLPIISSAADSYTMTTGQTVIVNAGGSGAGFNQLAEGQTDIGMMSRDITPSELADYPDLDFQVIAIGTDAVVPVISSEIFDAGVTALTREQIAAIYRGEIDNWSAFGGPDRDILVIDKEASSGTRHTYMEFIMGDRDALAPGADLVTGANNEEQTAITQSDSAIGLLSHAWLNDDVKGLALIMDGNRIEPTLANIQSGLFPITRDLNIVVRSDIAPAAQNFVAYLLSSDGQAFVESSGYVTLGK